MGLSTRSPARGISFETNILAARYSGGGAAADCVKVAGRGITSVAYNAATGAYRITFDAVGRNLLYVNIGIEAAGTTAGMRIANVTKSTYSATNKTLDFFVTDVATPTAKDLATDEVANILVIWSDTEVP